MKAGRRTVTCPDVRSSPRASTSKMVTASDRSLATIIRLSSVRAKNHGHLPPLGSHRRLVAEGRPPLTFAFHDSESLSPGVVRDILVKQVGLSRDEALKVVK